MRGQYQRSFSAEDAVDKAAQAHKEACELRLARIQNGQHPEYQNGVQSEQRIKQKDSP